MTALRASAPCIPGILVTLGTFLVCKALESLAMIKVVDDPVSRSTSAIAVCPFGVWTLIWQVINKVVS